MGQYRNDYDLMKKMIGNMKAGMVQGQSRLNEELNTSQLSQPELEDEENKFKEAIEGAAVTFGKFILNPQARNVEWSGFFPSENIAWNFSLDSSKGCYISADAAQLSDEMVQKLQKLKAYYDQWAQYWANEVS